MVVVGVASPAGLVVVVVQVVEVVVLEPSGLGTALVGCDWFVTNEP